MIRVNLIGFKQFENAMKKLPENLKSEVHTCVKGAADQYRGLAIDAAPADVVNPGIRSGIKVEHISDLNYEVVSHAKHSAPMEFGTKGKFQPIAGVDMSGFKGQPKGGTFEQMVDRLTKWVHRKGIAGTYSTGIKKTKAGFVKGKSKGKRTGNKKTQARQDKQVAYVIARSIVKNGVTPQPFFFKQLPIVRKDFFRNVRNILNTVLD